jgi:tRNA A22 N-methylase
LLNCSFRRKAAEETCRENQYNISFSILFSENQAVYEIITKNTAEPGRPQMSEHNMAQRTFDLLAG